MTLVTSIVFGMLVVAGILSLVRLLRASSLADRIVASDTLLVVIVCGIAVHAARTGSGIYLDVMVVVALLGFAGTTLVARFIEGRGAR